MDNILLFDFNFGLCETLRAWFYLWARFGGAGRSGRLRGGFWWCVAQGKIGEVSRFGGSTRTRIIRRKPARHVATLKYTTIREIDVRFKGNY
jgi:hypothetical protein